MWYNPKTAKHRWQPLTGEQVASKLLALCKASKYDDVCPLRYAYIGETLSDARVLKPGAQGTEPQFQWGDDTAHSVPTTHPLDPRKEKWGSAAADQALLLLRLTAARTSPLPPEAGRDVKGWRCCATGGVLSLAEYGSLRRNQEHGFWEFGAHKLLLPRNGTAIHGRALEWKQEPATVRPGKTWRCVLLEWTERDRRLLVDMARGFTISESKPPDVTHGAVRIKGHPWDTRKRPPKSARHPLTGELQPVRAQEDGTDSELEGLFVFASKQTATALQGVLPGATWTPVTFAAWEEEVQHFGLFDIAFDHTRCSRADPELDHWIELMWAGQRLPDQKGSRSSKTVVEGSCSFPDGQLFASPLTATETHAVLLASNPNGQLMWSIEQLSESGEWPASVPLSAVESLRMLQLQVRHWGSFYQVRDMLGRVRGEYDKYFGHHGESSGEQLERLQAVEAELQGADPSKLAHVSLSALDIRSASDHMDE